MVTKNTFEDALHEAMRQKDEIAKNTFKVLLSSIKMAEIDKGVQADEALIQTILQKEIKMRKESITEFQKGGREDLTKKAETEIDILQKYLPAQMSEEELKKIVSETIKEVNATQPSDMGKVMKALLPKVSGKAPADRVSAAVKALLS